MSPRVAGTKDQIDQPEVVEECSDQMITATKELFASSMQPQVYCEWIDEANKQLVAIANLPAGWDSYGAQPPNLRLVRAASGLLRCLARVAWLTKPHVNPSPAGGVQFEWEAGPRSLEIEVVDEQTATYFFQDEATGIEEEGRISEGDSLDLITEFLWQVDDNS